MGLYLARTPKSEKNNYTILEAVAVKRIQYEFIYADVQTAQVLLYSSSRDCCISPRFRSQADPRFLGCRLVKSTAWEV